MNEELALEALTEFLNAVEAGIQAAKRRIKEAKGIDAQHDPKEFDTLFWEDLSGTKGPFQRTSKKATNNSELFQALQSILEEHKGFMHFGDYKYWFDQGNKDIIDRRKA